MSDRDDLEQLTGDRDPGMVKGGPALPREEPPMTDIASATHELTGALGDASGITFDADAAGLRQGSGLLAFRGEAPLRDVLTFHADGTIKVGEGVTADEAAAAVVEALRPRFATMIAEERGRYPLRVVTAEPATVCPFRACSEPHVHGPTGERHNAFDNASEASKSGGLSAFERLEAAIGELRTWLDNDDPEAPIDDLHDIVGAFNEFTSAREPEPAKAPTTTQVAVDLALRSTTRKGGTDAERHADAMALVQAAHLVASVAGVPLAKLCPLCRHRPDAPDLSPEQHMTAFHGAPPDPDAALRDFMAALPSSQPGAKRGPVEAAFDKLDAAIDEHDGAEGITLAAEELYEVIGDRMREAATWAMAWRDAAREHARYDWAAMPGLVEAVASLAPVGKRYEGIDAVLDAWRRFIKAPSESVLVTKA